jgi:hypothetical protein
MITRSPTIGGSLRLPPHPLLEFSINILQTTVTQRSAGSHLIVYSNGASASVSLITKNRYIPQLRCTQVRTSHHLMNQTGTPL